MSSQNSVISQSTLLSQKNLMIAAGTLLLLVAVVVTVVVLRRRKEKEEHRKKHESFAQSPYGALASTRQRSRVDYQHDPSSNPHSLALMSSYYKPLNEGVVDFEEAGRALNEGRLFDDLRNDFHGAGHELLPADERSLSQLIREGKIEEARRLERAILARAQKAMHPDPHIRRPTQHFE